MTPRVRRARRAWPRRFRCRGRRRESALRACWSSWSVFSAEEGTVSILTRHTGHVRHGLSAFDRRHVAVLWMLERPMIENIPFNVARTEERSVGKECVSTCRLQWSRYHQTKKIKEK